MSLKPGLEEAYRAEHRNIWRDVVEGITRYGIRNYSIFMTGNELYSYFEVDDLDRAMAQAAQDPVNRRWQEHMADFFLTSPGIQDGSTVYPVEILHVAGATDSSAPYRRSASLEHLVEARQSEFQATAARGLAELQAQIRRLPVRNWSLYLIGTRVFEYVEAPEPETFLAQRADMPAYRAWRAGLEPLFKPNSRAALESVFYLE